MTEPKEHVSFRPERRPGIGPAFDQLIVTIHVGGEMAVEFLTSPIYGQSTIGRNVYTQLRDRGVIEETTGSRYLLRNLSIDGQPIRDFEVMIYDVRNVSKLGADFFRNYAQVGWEPATDIVTLFP